MNTATPLSALNRILIRAVLALGENGERERACRLAAQALAALRHDHPREAERLNGVLHALTRTTDPPTRHMEHVMSQTLDVRELIPMERHRRIFETYHKLKPGESFVLVNDHDPKPLYYQFDAEHKGHFSWKYLEQGPSTWRVEIGRV